VAQIHPRVIRERKTVELMIALYCRDHHQAKQTTCTACQELMEYARFRLQSCPFQEEKTTCGNCRVHCYKPAMRKKIREVMKYAGPRMLWRHPLLAIGHMIDGWRTPPKKKK